MDQKEEQQKVEQESRIETGDGRSVHKKRRNRRRKGEIKKREGNKEINRKVEKEEKERRIKDGELREQEEKHGGKRVRRGNGERTEIKGRIKDIKIRNTELENEIGTLKGIHNKLINIENLENGSLIEITRVTDHSPISGEKYFPLTDLKYRKDEYDGLSVVIPFYNEENHELQSSLHSLYKSWIYAKQHSRKWNNKGLRVFLIQDGWSKASKSMKEYMKRMFPKRIDGVNWWEHYREFRGEYDKEVDGDVSYIFESEYPIKINHQSELSESIQNVRMDITLMIKINNRKKHNSHEWFFGEGGFSENSGSEYLFLTDAFTLFRKECLWHLLKELDRDKKLAGVTGRQRVMTKEQQGTTEGIFSLAHWLRMLQLYDFETANSVYNGAFSMGGYLPVVPGPCGLYRRGDLEQKTVRKSYFDVVNRNPDEAGLLLNNVQIAEDRVLTNDVLTKNENERFLKISPHAIFYFEAETEIKPFVLQRRRWQNGSLAGYAYILLKEPSMFWGWKTNIIRKLYVFFLLFMQLITYLAVAMAPSVTGRIFFHGLTYMLREFGYELGIIDTFVLTILFWVIYLMHIYIHHNNPFNSAVFIILVILSFVTSLFGFSALIYFIYNDEMMLYELLSLTHSAEYTSVYALQLGLLVLFLPFVTSALISGCGHSPLYILKSFIPYLFMSHILITWFGTYSYSRLWDVTWGNRPSDGSREAEKQKLVTENFRHKNLVIIIFFIIANIVCFFLPTHIFSYGISVLFIMSLFQMSMSLVYFFVRLYEKFYTRCCIKCCINKNLDIDEQNDDEISSICEDDIHYLNSLNQEYIEDENHFYI